MDMLYHLKEILSNHHLLDRSVPLHARYQLAFQLDGVREILEIEAPRVDDFTEVLSVEHGRVYALRMDLNTGVDNHKKPVVAGLILRGVLQGRIPRKNVDTLIDSGSFNSALALTYYSEKFGMNGIYVMSRYFPQDVVDILESPRFSVIRAPYKYDDAREREYYEHLVELLSHSDFRRNKFCLWHAKYGGEALYPLGREIARGVRHLDSSVSCVGSGSTLEGLQIAIQDHFIAQGSMHTARILVAEHELSPLFARFLPPDANKEGISLDHIVADSDFRQIEGLPHLVIGTHYDEINSRLSQKSINRVEGVIQYSDHDWKSMQNRLACSGIEIGNSSAANLSAAARLARQGNTVITIIFEPMREFYRELR